LHFTLRGRITKNFNICVNALKPQRARGQGKTRGSVRHNFMRGSRKLAVLKDSRHCPIVFLVKTAKRQIRINNIPVIRGVLAPNSY
jgi:hypothetical protein